MLLVEADAQKFFPDCGPDPATPVVRMDGVADVTLAVPAVSDMEFPKADHPIVRCGCSPHVSGALVAGIPGRDCCLGKCSSVFGGIRTPRLETARLGS
jgi:hypothetical protein